MPASMGCKDGLVLLGAIVAAGCWNANPAKFPLVASQSCGEYGKAASARLHAHEIVRMF